MKSASPYRIVLVTVPDRKTGRLLAKAALEARLIACANLLPGVESHYRWQGKLQQGGEILMLLKSSQSSLKALERLILAKHPYDTPEMLVLNIESGTPKYVRWLADCLKPSP